MGLYLLIVKIGVFSFYVEPKRKTDKYIGSRKLVAQQQTWAGRLAWLGHLLDVQKVAGPNPVRPIFPVILP
jgi:hypothetical protein